MLSAVVGLGLGALATATAHSRTWTDASGEHTVEADFVSLAGGNITLKTTSGKVTTFPLANLSAADRAFAEKLAKAGDPDPATGGEMTTTAKAKVREYFKSEDGVQTSTKHLIVEVDLLGGDAAAAFAAKPGVAEPAMVDGKPLANEEGLGLDGFEIIDREAEGIFAEHPKDGVRAELHFGKLPEGAKTVELVKGKVPVLVGGEAKVVELKDVLNHATGAVEDPVLTAVGLELSFERQLLGEDTSVQITIPEDSKGFSKLELVGADGKPVETNGSGSGSGGGKVSHSLSAATDALGGASLRVHIRDGAREMELPFEVKGIAIENN